MVRIVSTGYVPSDMAENDVYGWALNNPFMDDCNRNMIAENNQGDQHGEEESNKKNE